MMFRHDPEAVLDYVFDWTHWLSDGETITEATITADSGVTVDGTVIGAQMVTVWIGSGSEVADYQVRCAITTSDSRQDRRQITISVRHR